MLRKILVIFFILILLAVGGIVYLNKVFLPIQLKQIISQKSKEFLQRDISYREIVFEPLKGLVIKDLVIYEKGDARTPFLKVDEAYARILLPSIFKEFKLLIPSITLTQPYVHLSRSAGGEWNFADVLLPRAKTSAKTPFSVMVGGVAVTGGRIQITDRYVNPVSIESWYNISAKVNLAFNKSIKFDIEIPSGPQKVYLKASGHYFFTSNDVDADVTAQNLNIAKYLNLFYPLPNTTLREGTIEQAKFFVSHKKDSDDIRGQLIATADLNQGTARHFRGRLNVQNLNFSRQKSNLSFGVQLAGKGLAFAWDGYSFQGDVATRGITLTAEGINGTAKGELELANSTTTWAPENKIQGDFSLKNFQASRQGDDFSIKLTLAAPKASGTIDGNSFESGINIPDLVFNRKNKNFLADAGLTLTGLAIKLPEGVKLSAGDVTATDLSLKGTAADFQMSGNFAIEKLLFANSDVTIKTDSFSLPLQALSKNNQVALLFSPTVTNVEIPLEAKQTIKVANISGKDIQANIRKDGFVLKGALSTEQLVASLAQKQEFAAAPQIKFEIQNNPADKTPLRYRGHVTLEAATFKGAPVVGDIQKISGAIDFENDAASTEKLSFVVLNTPATASGSVTNFQKPTAKIKASADGVDLAALRPFLDSYLKASGRGAPQARSPLGDLPEFSLGRDEGIKPSGKADLVVNFTGSLTAPEKAQISATAVLREAVVEGGNLPAPISKISGILRYSPDQLAWENLRGVFQGTRYTLNGDLKDFSRPLVNIKAESEDLILNSQFKMGDDIITVSECSGRYLDSGFDVSGKIQPGKNEDPFLDISGHLNLNLSDLPLLNPAWKGLKDLKPAGDLVADFAFKGRPKDYARGKISLTAKGSQVSINTYKIRDFNLNFRHGESEFGKIKLTGDFYNGALVIDGFTSIQKDPPTFHLTGNLTGTDLAEIRKDDKWKGQDVSGSLSAMVDMEGPMTDTNAIRGKASFLIRDGVLWEMNFLQGLFKALLIPELGNVAFTEASGNFAVTDGKFQTNDLFFKGTIADLMGKGWIDFKGNLNLDVSPNFKQLELTQSESLRKGPTTILADMGGLNIKVTGSLKNPQYLVNTLPAKVLQKATETIFEGVQGIVDGILNQ